MKRSHYVQKLITGHHWSRNKSNNFRNGLLPKPEEPFFDLPLRIWDRYPEAMTLTST